MDRDRALRRRIAAAARVLAREKADKLSSLKAERRELERPDFLWHFLLHSFATMGKARGWDNLVADAENYCRLRYDALLALPPEERRRRVLRCCKRAAIRMPNNKTRFILRCFEQIRELGGPEAARKMLLAQPGREGKIAFLKSFHGIGDKYARNILMEVWHEEFRDCIAIDLRIKSLSRAWGLSFNSYAEHEAFYRTAAAEAGLSGWELDRLMFHFTREFRARVAPAATGAMAVRTYRAEDAAAVARLWRECGLTEPGEDTRGEIRRKAAFQPDLFLVGAEGGRVVATVVAGYDGRRGWLNRLAVAPDRRRAGLGARMVAEAEKRLRALGCVKVNLMVRRTNAAVVGFYRKLGYAEFDAICMSKRMRRDG